jgi:serine phosphatase RsbU (regulator of sigma subunit)
MKFHETKIYTVMSVSYSKDMEEKQHASKKAKTSAERCKKYRLLHPEEVKKSNREQYIKNREKILKSRIDARKKKEQEIEEMRHVYILYKEGKLLPQVD